MAKANPTRPNPPESEARLHDPAALPDTSPPLRDELDDQPGDDGSHRSFADDVRSDSNDDEKHERR